MDVLQQLRKANRERCEAFGHGGVQNWQLSQWSNAVAGEVGEMCNVVKKIERGDTFDRDGKTPMDVELLAKEAADAVIYIDLLCQRAGVDLKTAIVNKFNEKSDDIGSPIKIYYY